MKEFDIDFEIEKTTVDLLVLLTSLSKPSKPTTAKEIRDMQREKMREFLHPWRDIPRAWFWLSGQMAIRNQLVAALIACDEGLGIDPDSAVGWSFRGSILHLGHRDLIGKHLEAIKSCRDIDELWNLRNRQIEPITKFRIESFLCRKLERQFSLNDIPEIAEEIIHLSIEACQKSVELEPEVATFWYGLGESLSVSFKKSSEAEDAFRKAIELDSQTLNYWLTLYKWYLKFNRKKDAKELEKQAKKHKVNLKKEYKEGFEATQRE